MTDATGLHPFFLAGSAGSLFALFHAPRPGVPVRDGLIFVPPFAEEMNRSRRVVTLQAQALAARGHGVLVLDLFGTGDSAGNFTDATWQQWLADIATATTWMEREHGGAIALWGLRLGATLAAAAAARAEAGRYTRLVLWEPVVRGETFLTQVLRARIAAGLGRDGETTETTADMRRRLAGGEVLEVGGYGIAPELAAALDALDLASAPPSGQGAVLWLETTGPDGGALSPAARRVIEAWRATGLAVIAGTVPAPRFWTLIETTVAPKLVEATCRMLDGDDA